jgi:predicted SPOUT superfamily RNA methylase MTH1
MVSDTPHLREKTAKVGLVARAAAIFQVGEVIVYPDNPRVNQRGDMELVTRLLAYAETPQYLRKRLFKLTPELKYAGILPPLRTPHHPTNRESRRLRVGDYREGFVVSRAPGGLLVDVGVERLATMTPINARVGERVTVKVTSVDDVLAVQRASRAEIPVYWGYCVRNEKRSFSKLVEEGRFDLTVATSRLGSPFMKVAAELVVRWRQARKVLIAFGAPARGLHEVVKTEGGVLEDLVDFVVNTVPNQGTETVRTEEAIIATLAIFNVQVNG